MSRIIWNTKSYSNGIYYNKYVCKLLQRFIDRLHCKEPIDLYVNNLIVNENIINKVSSGLQLYYPTLYENHSQIQDRLKCIGKSSIFNYFDLIHSYSSAHGYNPHLYSHSRTSFMLSRYNVFICNVKPNEEYIKRYVSEIYSPHNNNTYVIKDNKLITPLIYFEYTLCKRGLHADILKNERLFTNSIIDNNEIKPTIDKNDIV